MNGLVRTRDRSAQTTNHRPDGRSVEDLGGSPTDFHRSLGSPSQPCETNRRGDRVAELVAIVVLDPQNAHEPLRSASTEALTNKVGVSWIRAAKPEGDHLFNNAVDHTVGDRRSPRLQVVEPPKEAVEALRVQLQRWLDTGLLARLADQRPQGPTRIIEADELGSLPSQ